MFVIFSFKCVYRFFQKAFFPPIIIYILKPFVSVVLSRFQAEIDMLSYALLRQSLVHWPRPSSTDSDEGSTVLVTISPCPRWTIDNSSTSNTFAKLTRRKITWPSSWIQLVKVTPWRYLKMNFPAILCKKRVFINVVDSRKSTTVTTVCSKISQLTFNQTFSEIAWGFSLKNHINYPGNYSKIIRN